MCSSKSNVSKGGAAEFYFPSNETATKIMFFYVSSTLLGSVAIKSLLCMVILLFIKDEFVTEAHF